MLSVIMTTFINILGPGLALRGPEGSLKRAVDGMHGFQNQVGARAPHAASARPRPSAQSTVLRWSIGSTSGAT